MIDPRKALWRRSWSFFLAALIAAIATVEAVAFTVGHDHPFVSFGVLLGVIVTARLAKENGVTLARIEVLDDLEKLQRRGGPGGAS